MLAFGEFFVGKMVPCFFHSFCLFFWGGGWELFFGGICFFNIWCQKHPKKNWSGKFGLWKNRCKKPGKNKTWCQQKLWSFVPGSKLLILGMVILPLIGNPCNGHINPYYKVDDHPYHPKSRPIPFASVTQGTCNVTKRSRHRIGEYVGYLRIWYLIVEIYHILIMDTMIE